MKACKSMLLVLVVMALIAPACAPTATPTEEAEEAATEEVREVRVGVIAPYTGAWADGGTRQLQGAQLKLAELEKDPEYAGLKITLVPCDDASNNDQGVACAKKLILENEVHAILGALNSNVTLAIVPVTKQYGVSEFTLSGAMAICQQDSEYIFRTTPNEERLAKYTLWYFLSQGYDKVAIIHETDAFGSAGGEGMKMALEEKGLEPVAFETWDRGDKDFSAQLSKIQASGAQALSLNGGAPDSAVITKQLIEMGMGMPIYGSQLSTFNFRDLAGESQNGVVFAAAFTSASDDEYTKKFLDGFMQTWGREGDNWAASHYYSLHTIADAVKAASEWGKDLKADRDWVKDFVHENGQTDPLVEGMVYDEAGEPDFNAYIVEIQDLKDVVVGRRDDFAE